MEQELHDIVMNVFLHWKSTIDCSEKTSGSSDPCMFS